MKKNILLLLLALIVNVINAQHTLNGEGKSYIEDINQMFAAAPTANNLMKFEEVPVSYYTGVPDINIPLFNIPTNNKNIAVNVQLKYHPMNAKPDDRSGETGLGWSLIAGGSIVRTVRGGNPDEKNRSVLLSSPPKSKFGIYDTTTNLTSKLINNDPSVNINEYSFYAAMGKYDTEYDLYQYNFLGFTGRFYVMKDSNNSYVAVKLDKNNLKITCSYDGVEHALKSFTIIDDKGIRYDFEGMEKSGKSITTVKNHIITGSGDLYPSVEIGDYYTSYHLVRINDQRNVNLVTFKYLRHSEVKYQDTPTTISRMASNIGYTNTTFNQEPPSGLPGAFERQLVYNTSQTYLLTDIDIVGRGTIYFNYEQGRSDSNYAEPQNLYKLKSVQTNFVGQPATQYTEKFIMDYGYSNVQYQAYNGPQALQKLLLKKVTKVSANNQNQENSIEYNEGNFFGLQKDKWGFYAGSGITTDVIKSITYPTKGKVVFNFEENEYSYNPVANDNVMAAVTGYNTSTPYEFSIHFGQFNDLYKQNFFSIQSAQHVQLDLWLGNLIYYDWKFQIFKKNADNTFSPAVFTFEYGNQTCNKPQPPACPNSNINQNGEIKSEFHPAVYLEPGTYYASLSGNFAFSNPSNTLDTFVAHTSEPMYVDMKKYKGGGFRIGDISYYENPLSADPTKRYIYNYDNLDEAGRSSGALVFPVPVFNYDEYYSYNSNTMNGVIIYNAMFNTETDYNIIPVQKTQGGDVGYKYVTVKQVDNNNISKGKTVYKFRSPLDFPNQSIIYTQMPIVPIPNQDYLRGQTIWEKKYDSDNRIVSQTDFDYNITEYEVNDGIKIKDNFYNNMITKYYQYAGYSDFFNWYGNLALTSPYKNIERFGISLPSQKVETSYFYKNGVQSSVAATTNTLYNSLDYPTSVTQNFSDGNSNLISYKYAHEKGNTRLINANMIGVALETENKKNNKTISKVETMFNDVNHFLPTSLVSTDFAGVSATEVTYNQYDAKGNLLQYTTKDGIVVSIIWGYNGTQPIAKVANYPYSAVIALASSIVSASDQGAVNPSNEANLIAQLNAFRQLPDLSEAQITTYTYDPLIGVTSITPPSGIREVYLYDTANRLKEIRENSASGKILKEFKYNYKQ